VSGIEKDNASIKEPVKQQDLPRPVATSKGVQNKIYIAQLILAGKNPKS
jgi:hypothetical protein